MQTHKLVASRHLAKTMRRQDFSVLVDACHSERNRIRSEYGSDLKSARTDARLAHMMAIDSAFVVQILRCCSSSSMAGPGNQPLKVIRGAGESFEDYYRSKFSRPLQRSILQDLVLLENQVPLFLLQKVVSLDYNRCDTEGKAMEILANLVQAFGAEVVSCVAGHHFTANKVSKCKHLLDCVYTAITEDEQSLACDGPAVLNPTHFPSATELQNGGIFLKPTAGTFAITYDPKKATLYVPLVRVSDDTERLFRNLVAYESHLVGESAIGFVSYLRFMNSLVDTHDDVMLLVQRGILAQDIGNNHDVAAMWNKLCVNTMRICTQRHETIAKQLSQHCKSSLNTLKAEFKRTYLSRPWLVISLLSAAGLLLMTLVIMVYTIELYLKPGEL